MTLNVLAFGMAYIQICEIYDIRFGYYIPQNQFFYNLGWDRGKNGGSWNFRDNERWNRAFKCENLLNQEVQNNEKLFKIKTSNITKD